jgi:hypothetical protein
VHCWAQTHSLQKPRSEIEGEEIVVAVLLTDACTVWLKTHSLQECPPPIPETAIGTTLRIVSPGSITSSGLGVFLPEAGTSRNPLVLEDGKESEDEHDEYPEFQLFTSEQEVSFD